MVVALCGPVLTGGASPAVSKQIVVFAFCFRGSLGSVNRRAQRMLEKMGSCFVLGWGFVGIWWLILFFFSPQVGVKSILRYNYYT